MRWFIQISLFIYIYIYIYIEREREREHAHTKFIWIDKRQDSTTKGYNIQVSMKNHLCDFQNFI